MNVTTYYAYRQMINAERAERAKRQQQEQKGVRRHRFGVEPAEQKVEKRP